MPIFRLAALVTFLVFAAPHWALAAPREDAGPVGVIVRLADAPLARYGGGTPGLPATRAAAGGGRRLDPRSASSRAYLAHLDRQMDEFERAARRAAPSARLVYRYRLVLGGVAMALQPEDVPHIAALPGVVSVSPDLARPLDTDRSPKLVGARTLWKALGGAGKAGEGVVVGILDTGIWPEHPSFADPDPSGVPYPAPPATWNGGHGPVCEAPSDGSAPLLCNNKLIGARKFLAGYKAVFPLAPGEFDSTRDSDGHGTHTASTAAGNGGVAATLLGVARGEVSGIAPRAHVAMYRVCGHEPPDGGGCFQSDSVAAVEQAVLDGVDVINFSIGGGGDPYTDVVSQAFLDAYAAGVFVAASAGNDGPAADTVSHREPWVTTVAASSHVRQFQGTAKLSAASPRGTLKLVGTSITSGISDAAPVVWAGHFGDQLCLMPFAPGTFAGAIVACQRGVIARVAKGANVAAGGAGGLILYNPAPQTLSADNHFLPALHIQNDLGDALVDFLTTHGGVTGVLKAGKAKKARADVVAAFSSRGGPGQTLGVSKPDLTAPGVQILAGNTPAPDTSTEFRAGELFQAIEGTSMSSPHVAGAAALLRALHPDWSPGQIRSALMTTARTKKLVSEDGKTPAEPFAVGSGRLDLKAVRAPGVTIDTVAASYVDRKNDLWNANYPSLYVPAMPATLTTSRTLHNVAGKKLTLKFKVQAPSDLVVTVPNKLVLGPGEEAMLAIALDARAVPPGTVRHAHLRAKNFHFPITIVRAP